MDEAVVPRLEATLAADAEASGGGRWQEALRAMTVTALVTPLDGYTVPLIARGQWLGALAIGRHPGQRRDQDELTIGEDLARRAALAMDNARSHDERRRVAEALQRALLPATLPQVEGIGLAAEYVPATDGVDVGGDFYDVTALPDGRCLILVGDVSGKGAQAASVTGLVREVFRVLVRDGRVLTSVLSTLNETLYERRERHCTLALADVSREGDLLHVSVYLAGHDRPLLVRQDGTLTTIGEWGTALGLLEEVTCPVATVTLEPGDSLVFYTDGVTDRRRGAEFYGIDRLKTAARQVAGYPADVVAARLRTAALDFSAEPQRDDMAIVVLRNES
jgi:serine phosphatase RsbU (regulator of sigma subunit)